MILLSLNQFIETKDCVEDMIRIHVSFKVFFHMHAYAVFHELSLFKFLMIPIASPSGSSWSPTDSSGSPNAYPPPPPNRLRHSESFPPDARRASFALDRPPPYNHPPPHLNNRSPTDGQWRAEAQRRHARSHPDDDYFFPRRVDFIGPPPHPPLPSHLRDPRLNRGPGVPSPSHSHSGCSPQPHNQAPQSTTSSPRISSAPTRRSNISQILDEHSYFEKCEPSEAPSNTSSKTATSQQESQVDGLGRPRHMLSQVYSVIMNKSASPLNSRTEELEKTYVRIEPRGSLPTSKELKDVLALVASSSAAADLKSVSEEASIKQDSKNIAISGVVKEVKKEPPVSAAKAKESPCPSDEESDQLKDDELDADQISQNEKTPDSGYPDSPAVSLSGYDLDLDEEPTSGESSDEEEEEASETDVHSEDEILQLAPTSFVSNTRKSRNTDTTTTQEEVEAEPSKISQSNSRVLRNRILPCSTTSTSHTTRRQPVAVLDNKVPSLRLSLSRDGILHSKIEDSLKQQPRTTRRSRRLATSQDAVAENSEEKADETAPPKVSVPIDGTESSENARGAPENPSLRTSAETTAKELTKEERMLLNMANARAAKASKEKRRSRRLFSGHRKRTQSVSFQGLFRMSVLQNNNYNFCSGSVKETRN